MLTTSLNGTKSHTCNSKCTCTTSKTSPLATFPIDTATTRLEAKKRNEPQTVLHPQTPYQENFFT
jgi:hypothetical protein